MEQLPVELLWYLLRFILPGDLKSLCCVNRRFKTVVFPYILKNFGGHLTISNNEVEEKALSNFEFPLLVRIVHLNFNFLFAGVIDLTLFPNVGTLEIKGVFAKDILLPNNVLTVEILSKTYLGGDTDDRLKLFVRSNLRRLVEIEKNSLLESWAQ